MISSLCDPNMLPFQANVEDAIIAIDDIVLQNEPCSKFVISVVAFIYDSRFLTRNQGFMAHLIDLICLSISFAKVRERMLSGADALGSGCGSGCSRELMLSGADAGADTRGDSWVSDWLRQITWQMGADAGADAGADSLSTLWLAQTSHMT